VIIGILPFFHSFGLTVTLHTVMALDVGGAYHFNPLDARQVGKLVQQRRGTILLATPTFLRTYVRRCTKEDFATLDTVVAGAEKLPQDLADEFEAKFGVRPVEGYGTTELSPLVSVNLPSSRRLSGEGREACEGSVGKPIPGVSARIVDVESGEDLPVGQSGMLLIAGPNVMKGYLKDPQKTAEVMRDGWYVTGDIARLDEDGFIHITDRQSRFSKIGGEMVPHGRVEEELLRQLGTSDADQLPLAVTAIPDPRKGERLVVVHGPALEKTPAQLCEGLRAAGLPNLFIPGQDSFVQIDELPVLGTGKLDLKRIKQIALERLESDR
jgi:acyl-[acyl-carrier-protein]-phospholipid O-acyltransferase/long-chain-fatty-acid--[acyl-carrier-protein] ligase